MAFFDWLRKPKPQVPTERPSWTCATTTTADGIRLELPSLTFADVLELWKEDADFRTFWVSSLRSVTDPAFCWETPALTRAMMSAPFECMAINSPALAGQTADSKPFQEHFAIGTTAVTFRSLRGDAVLVAPCPVEAGTNYTHLASFLRTADPENAAGIWQNVARAVESRLGRQPIWLSTAGLGVSWLHVRIDSTPKYYRFGPYKAAPNGSRNG